MKHLNLLNALSYFADHDRDITVQTLRYLLYVYQYPGRSITAVGEALGDPAGMASRYFQVLSRGGKSTLKQGYGWVALHDDPDHGLRKNAYLSPKGQQIIGDMLKALEK